MHLHVYKRVAIKGLNEYSQCRCGKRTYFRRGRRGFSPVDRQWLETGAWTEEPTTPPRSPSGVGSANQSDVRPRDPKTGRFLPRQQQ